jgi:predicted nucleotidyltransferase
MRCENETTEVLQRAKRIITEEVEKAGCRVVKVILFGSRARGDARADSDWDFLVVVDRGLPVSQLWDIADDIRLRFARSEFWGDVFIQPLTVVEQQQTDTGCLTYYALREGIDL